MCVETTFFESPLISVLAVFSFISYFVKGLAVSTKEKLACHPIERTPPFGETDNPSFSTKSTFIKTVGIEFFKDEMCNLLLCCISILIYFIHFLWSTKPK